MYRLILESLLGLRLEVDILHVEPCIPAGWEGFTVHYRYRESVYHIKVFQGQVGTDEDTVTVDGVVQQARTIHLVDDRSEHFVDVVVFSGSMIDLGIDSGIDSGKAS
jgi:cellobiose phosphorylase